ncbi:hypothetical protein C8R48DRAFT_674075 [Suillus tomentosus]|nr:hypothetical protein C8R48DRAFT_674075 [Suillus tomentosus]
MTNFFLVLHDWLVIEDKETLGAWHVPVYMMCGCVAPGASIKILGRLLSRAFDFGRKVVKSNSELAGVNKDHMSDHSIDEATYHDAHGSQELVHLTLGLYMVLLNINMSAGRQETKMVDCDALNPAHVDNSDCVYQSADVNNGYEGIMQADAEYISYSPCNENEFMMVSSWPIGTIVWYNQVSQYTGMSHTIV